MSDPVLLLMEEILNVCSLLTRFYTSQVVQDFFPSTVPAGLANDAVVLVDLVGEHVAFQAKHAPADVSPPPPQAKKWWLLNQAFLRETGVLLFIPLVKPCFQLSVQGPGLGSGFRFLSEGWSFPGHALRRGSMQLAGWRPGCGDVGKATKSWMIWGF